MNVLRRAELEELATYNAECHRGVTHTVEQDSRMAILKQQYLDDLLAEARARGDWVSRGGLHVLDGRWIDSDRCVSWCSCGLSFYGFDVATADAKVRLHWTDVQPPGSND